MVGRTGDASPLSPAVVTPLSTMQNVKSWSRKSVEVAVRRTDLDPGEEKDSGDCKVERVSGGGGGVEVLVSVETAHLGDEMVGRGA